MLPLYQCCLLPDFQPLPAAAIGRIANPPKKVAGTCQKGLVNATGEPLRLRFTGNRYKFQAVAGTRRARSHVTAPITRTSNGMAAKLTAAQPTVW